MVAVVDTVSIEGKNCCTAGTGSQIVSQILPSGVNLYSFICSFPVCDLSPILLALGGGHSTSFGGIGVSGVSVFESGGGGGSPVFTGGGSSCSTFTVSHVNPSDL
tara:strand:+ start:1858 stop:2172 length:315 start_codon:yes stop_codon:yes gene_type:complete